MIGRMDDEKVRRLRGSSRNFLDASPRFRTGVLEKFRDRALVGSRAEGVVYNYMKSKGGLVYAFEHPRKLTETEIPREIKRLFEFMSFPPDAIVRLGPEIFFMDCKYKSKPTFVVNVTDYLRYFQLSKIVPVRVYFYVNSIQKLFYHVVTDPHNFKEERQWDGNLAYIIPEDLLVELEDFGVGKEFNPSIQYASLRDMEEAMLPEMELINLIHYAYHNLTREQIIKLNEKLFPMSCSKGGTHEWFPSESTEQPDYLMTCRKCLNIRLKSEVEREG